MIDAITALVDPLGPLSWLIWAGYLLAAFKLASVAVTHETRSYARWGMTSLAFTGFLFGIGRYLYAQGISEDWIFFFGHAMLIQHSFLVIWVARHARNENDKLRAGGKDELAGD